MRRGLFVAIALWSAVAQLCAHGDWVRLEGGQFLRKRANDGDSFHVSINAKEYIFRLYFIDTPESTAEFVKRVEDQANWFGITPEQTTRLGVLAKNFTRERLTGPFVIQTCWEDAGGRSRLQRFYAIVTTRNGDLSEQLVENGLAIVRGRQANPDGVTAARREWQKLNQLQQKARREKVGGWAGGSGMTTHTKSAEQYPLPNIPDSKLDVNTASATELENVPYIGPKIAQRIIEARPFVSADDLKRVSGIGDKTYERIRSYFK